MFKISIMLMRIGALSEQTGVSAELLRAWERRYGLLTPQRSPGGFRLYDDEDVACIRKMKSLTDAGLSASDAARHVMAAAVGSTLAQPGSPPLDAIRSQLGAAFRSFDEAALEAAIDSTFSTLDLDTATVEVFLPALRALGDDWSLGRVSVAQEHFALNVLRGRLLALARGWDSGLGPRALLACPPGEYHDVSLVLFGIAMHRRGWRITFLGANTPLDDIASAQERLSPRISVLFAANWDDHAAITSRLRTRLGDSVFLAGSTAGPLAAAIGCRWLAGNPVSEAETLTREADVRPDP